MIFALAWLGLALMVYAFIIEPHRLVVNPAELRLNNWEAKLNGLKIVAISDIHGGSNFVTETRIRAVVDKANAQDPDLIVLLGDYVSQNSFDRSVIKMPIERIAESLRGLKAKYGVYAVLGNHDRWFNNDNIKTALEGAGLTVLDDKVALIKTEAGEFWLAGFVDILPFKSRREYSDRQKRVLQAIDHPAPIIALTHNPDAAMMITDNREGAYHVSDDIVLLMAGHTHGGQVGIPFYGAPMVPSSFGYTRGHIVESGLDMFVTSGIGTSIMPVRLGVPPEISVVTIYRNN
jgi:predicted MPP superfamily phosphohydrolase